MAKAALKTASKKIAKPVKKPVAKAGSGTGAAKAKSSGQASGKDASRLIDQRIRELKGWRGETLARMRALILQTDPAMIGMEVDGYAGVVPRRDRVYG